MIKLTFKGTNTEYVATDFQEMVDKLKDNQWLDEEQRNDREAYMAGVARRVDIYCGIKMFYKNEQEFLLRLQELDIISLEVL